MPGPRHHHHHHHHRSRIILARARTRAHVDNGWVIHQTLLSTWSSGEQRSVGGRRSDDARWNTHHPTQPPPSQPPNPLNLYLMCNNIMHGSRSGYSCLFPLMVCARMERLVSCCCCPLCVRVCARVSEFVCSRRVL